MTPELDLIQSFLRYLLLLAVIWRILFFVIEKK